MRDEHTPSPPAADAALIPTVNDRASATWILTLRTQNDMRVFVRLMFRVFPEVRCLPALFTQIC
jgi:hypothetical protein